jgi:hypothetical protein
MSEIATKPARLPGASTVLSRGGWSQIVQIRDIMCADGVRRVTSWCGVPDTYFSLPCHVKIRGRTVSGFATQFRRADDSPDWQFCAARSGRNAFVLPDRSIHAVTRDHVGVVHFSTPAGYLHAKEGDATWNEESGEVHTITRIHRAPLSDFRTPWRMEFARNGWTKACEVA